MRYVFACLLASLGSMFVGLEAIAQTAPSTTRSTSTSLNSEPIRFTGAVPYSCEFSNGSSNNNVVSGVLAPEGSGPIYTTLSSFAPGGRSAEVDVLCNGTSNLEVGEPVQVEGPPVDADTEAFVSTTPDLGTTSSFEAPVEIPPGRLIVLTVDMIAEAKDISIGFPPSKNYAYEVMLTVSPGF